MHLQEIELTIDNEDKDGTYALSLVTNPATESDFIALNDNNSGSFQFKATPVNEERQIVVGFALIPEKRILRQKDGKQFNVFMTADTVAKSAELFMKNLSNANVTSQHSKPVQDCCVIESWIVEDAKNDKSTLFGLEPKGGEWVVMMKIYDKAEFDKAKTKEYNGFSIEGIYKGLDELLSAQGDECLSSEITNKIDYLLRKK
tara:strand:+ start:435 stop:1040 length:606 start_codon:yes stop_codon:yes gene_type:complete